MNALGCDFVLVPFMTNAMRIWKEVVNDGAILTPFTENITGVFCTPEVWPQLQENIRSQQYDTAINSIRTGRTLRFFAIGIGLGDRAVVVAYLCSLLGLIQSIKLFCDLLFVGPLQGGDKRMASHGSRY